MFACKTIINCMSNVNFYLPGFNVDFLKENLLFIDYMRRFPEYFRDINIKSFFGCFNNAIWNGGRSQLGYVYDIQSMKEMIEACNARNIAVRFTFTNCLIEEKHLNDTYCNTIMQLANNGFGNEVLVNSEILENYLRKEFPKFKFIKSTTCCERDVNKINNYTDGYDLVVIDYNDNKNEEFLNQIKAKDKIEILVNESCKPDCQYRKEHYKLISEMSLLQCSHVPSCFQSDCSCPNFYKNIQTLQKTMLTDTEIYDKYVQNGFLNFKIKGRDFKDPLAVLESCIYYLVKPEYRDIVREDITVMYVQKMIDIRNG